MDEVARVVLALEAPHVAEEVLHYLDRSGLARVVATAVDARQLAEAIRQPEPELVVAQPSLASAARGSTVVVLDGRESVAGLRRARGGGTGFFVWPGDRERLLGTVANRARGEAIRTAGRSLPSVLLAAGRAPRSWLPTLRRRWRARFDVCWSMATRSPTTSAPSSALPSTVFTRSATCCRWRISCRSADR